MSASVFARVWHLCTARRTATYFATAIAKREEEGSQKKEKTEVRRKTEEGKSGSQEEEGRIQKIEAEVRRKKTEERRKSKERRATDCGK